MALPGRAPARQPYHVYDDKINALGDARVVTTGEGDKQVRTVSLTRANAKYFLEQGIIGDKPLSEISDEQRKLLHQLTAGRSELPKDQLDKLKTPAAAEDAEEQRTEAQRSAETQHNTGRRTARARED